MNILGQPLEARHALWARLATGLLVGLAIAQLVPDGAQTPRAPDDPIDAEAWRRIIAMALGLTAFVVWAGAGAMRAGVLAAWSAVAFLIVFGVGVHDERFLDGFPGPIDNGGWFLIFPFLFIAHELLSSGDQARRVIAPWSTYFEEAWKRGVQLGLAIGFTLAFWAILWMGAALLGFIGFDWLKELLRNRHFALPATGLAFGAAVHLADVQTGILSSVRGLILGVLSWLLPVITLIGTIFAISLAFSGLKPLWDTKAATATLLSGCVGFVLLINAAYQEGDQERPVNAVLRWCVRIAGFLCFVFAVLAAWSLGLRIGQHGLTPERVLAGLAVLIALAYGIGYAVVACLPGRWMARIEPVNVTLAFVKVGLFAAIMSPLASPARLSVEDQLGRLERGVLTADTFDWWLLVQDTGRYGRVALKELSESPVPAVAAKAAAGLKGELGERPLPAPEPVDDPRPRPDLSKLEVVAPKGATPPASFLSNDFRASTGGPLPDCLRVEDKRAPDCALALIDLNGDGKPEVLVLQGTTLSLLAERDGRWGGDLGYAELGEAGAAAFRRGEVASAPAAWRDVLVGGRRVVAPNFPDSIGPSPAPPRAP
jgi:hypothetical protein